MSNPARQQQREPLKVTTHGTPVQGDFRALAALLVKLDAQPALRLVPGPAENGATPEGSEDDKPD